MVRLSCVALTKAHRFLLEIHAAGDVDALRRVVPEGLSDLISADRSSFNEIEIGDRRKSIVPTPVPAWWPQFGEVYSSHLLDHPLWNKRVAPGINRTVAISDRRYAHTFRRSALYNEYFLPLGVKHQIWVLAHREEQRSIGLALNRSRRDFSPEDRALLELVCPHITQAWRHLSLLAKFRSREEAPGEHPMSESAIVAVDAARGTLRALSPQAARILQKHFGAGSERSGRLPENVQRWLRGQETRRTEICAAVAAPISPLVLQGRNGELTVRVAQTLPTETLLVLVPGNGRRKDGGTPNDLTRREREILHWIGEGKRNSEIGIILGLSARTVGKHLEHVFAKLGVETRTAAARVAFELRIRVDA